MDISSVSVFKKTEEEILIIEGNWSLIPLFLHAWVNESHICFPTDLVQLPNIDSLLENEID
jgi:hypothetical protein